MTFVVIWHYINKTQLNWIEFCVLPLQTLSLVLKRIFKYIFQRSNTGLGTSSNRTQFLLYWPPSVGGSSWVTLWCGCKHLACSSLRTLFPSWLPQLASKQMSLHRQVGLHCPPEETQRGYHCIYNSAIHLFFGGYYDTFIKSLWNQRHLIFTCSILPNEADSTQSFQAVCEAVNQMKKNSGSVLPPFLKSKVKVSFWLRLEQAACEHHSAVPWQAEARL